MGANLRAPVFLTASAAFSFSKPMSMSWSKSEVAIVERCGWEFLEVHNGSYAVQHPQQMFRMEEGYFETTRM